MSIVGGILYKYPSLSAINALLEIYSVKRNSGKWVNFNTVKEGSVSKSRTKILTIIAYFEFFY
jgi:hypothetical protein